MAQNTQAYNARYYQTRRSEIIHRYHSQARWDRFRKRLRPVIRRLFSNHTFFLFFTFFLVGLSIHASLEFYESDGASPKLALIRALATEGLACALAALQATNYVSGWEKLFARVGCVFLICFSIGTASIKVFSSQEITDTRRTALQEQLSVDQKDLANLEAKLEESTKISKKLFRTSASGAETQLATKLSKLKHQVENLARENPEDPKIESMGSQVRALKRSLYEAKSSSIDQARLEAEIKTLKQSVKQLRQELISLPAEKSGQGETYLKFVLRAILVVFSCFLTHVFLRPGSYQVHAPKRIQSKQGYGPNDDPDGGRRRKKNFLADQVALNLPAEEKIVQLFPNSGPPSSRALKISRRSRPLSPLRRTKRPLKRINSLSPSRSTSQPLNAPL